MAAASTDAQLAAAALAAVDAKLGGPVTYRVITETGGNPTRGVDPTETPVDTEYTAVVRELSLEDVAMRGGSYQVGDIEVALPLAAVDAANGRLVYRGGVFRIVRHTPVYLFGAQGYLLQGRRE